MRTPRARIYTAALLLTAVGSLAACSSSDNDTSSVSSATDSTTQSAEKTNGNHVDLSSFDLQAHRGGRGENTEESKQAFETAIDEGARTLEGRRAGGVARSENRRREML